MYLYCPSYCMCMEVNTTANDESNGGENNYSEVRTADDARHVEVGDTVSVEINARPEREDCDEAVSTEPLVDCFDAEVTDVVDKLDGEHVDIKLDTGEIVSVTTRGSRSMWRQYACYSNHDDHNPENRVRIAVVDDDPEDEPVMMTDGGVDVADPSDFGLDDKSDYADLQVVMHVDDTNTVRGWDVLYDGDGMGAVKHSNRVWVGSIDDVKRFEAHLIAPMDETDGGEAVADDETVYIITKSVQYEDTGILSVYKNRRDAIAYLEETADEFGASVESSPYTGEPMVKVDDVMYSATVLPVEQSYTSIEGESYD